MKSTSSLALVTTSHQASEPECDGSILSAASQASSHLMTQSQLPKIIKNSENIHNSRQLPYVRKNGFVILRTICKEVNDKPSMICAVAPC